MVTTIYGKKVSLEAKKSLEASKTKIFGLSYPFTATTKGYMSKRTGISLVKGNISQLLKTSRGERVMLPDFGTNLETYLFEQLDETSAETIRDHVLDVLSVYAPEIEVLKFGVYETSQVNYTGIPGFVIRLTIKIIDTGHATDIEVKIG